MGKTLNIMLTVLLVAWLSSMNPMCVAAVDSTDRPMVNVTPGLPDWSQRDVDDLISEIEGLLNDPYATGTNSPEAEWILGNYIGQALVRRIDIGDLVDLTDRAVISESVVRSIIDYLQYYENLKHRWVMETGGEYAKTTYSEDVLDLLEAFGAEILQANPPISKDTPSGAYSLSIFTRGLTYLTSPTEIWSASNGTYDNQQADIPIGFSFKFYATDDADDNTYVRVSTNGYITFYQQGGGALDGTDMSNDSIPGSTDPDGFAAPWWDDLIVEPGTGTTDTVRYKTEGSVGSRVFTVEWRSVTRYGGDADDFHNFQVKLYENRYVIEFHYGTWVDDSIDTATVGIENYDGSDGDCGLDCSNTINARPSSNYRFTPKFIWTGHSDNDWNNSDNWATNDTPTSSDAVIIPDGAPRYPRLSGSLGIGTSGYTYDCGSLHIQSGGSVTIITGHSVYNLAELTIDGTLEAGDDIRLNNGSTTTITGALYNGTATGSHGELLLASGAVVNNNAGVIYTETLRTYGGCQFDSTTNGFLYLYVSGDAPSPQTIENDDSDSFFGKFLVLSGANVILADCNSDFCVHSTNLYGAFTNGSCTLTTSFMDSYDNGSCTVSDGLIDVIENGPYFHDSSTFTLSGGMVDSAGSIRFYEGSAATVTNGIIHLAEDFESVNGNFSADGGEVLIDGYLNSDIEGDPSFFNLTLNKDDASDYCFALGNFTVSNALDIHRGVFDPDGYTVTVSGPGGICVGNDSGVDDAFLTMSSGTIDITGTASNVKAIHILSDGQVNLVGGAINRVASISDDYYSVVHIESGGVWNQTGGTFTMDNDRYEWWWGTTIDSGGVFTITDGVYNNDCRIYNYGVMQCLGGTVNCASSLTELTAQWNNDSGSRIEATSCSFGNLPSTNGIYIQSGAQLGSAMGDDPYDFENCVFTDTCDTGFRCENGESFTITDVTFNNTGYNIYKDGDAGYIQVLGTQGGTRWGENFDYDSNNRIDWGAWTPTPTAVPPTDTPVPPTDTPVEPTNTPVVPTDTPVVPTDTPVIPTDTPVLPTGSPTITPIPDWCWYDGDLDNNEYITAADAIESFNIYMGLTEDPTDEQICSADCNGNLNISPADAQSIFEASLGLGECRDPVGGSPPGPSPTPTGTAGPTSNQLTAGSASGCTGSISIPITLSNPDSAIHTFGLDFNYCDHMLTFTGWTDGTLDPAWIFFGCNEVEPGRIRVGGTSFAGISAGSSGTIITLEFDITCSTCHSGDQCPLTLSNIVDDLYGYTITNGIFTYPCEGTPEPTPEPTDTPVPVSPTPSTGILNGSIAFERPGTTVPHESWSVPIRVTLCVGGILEDVYQTQTDTNGDFSVQLPPGMWDILIKNEHTLAVRQDDVFISEVLPVELDFGVMAEGDADDNNVVTSADFFILRSTYNMSEGDPGYDDRADFNEDQIVTSTDFFLLRGHYNQAGASCE